MEARGENGARARVPAWDELGLKDIKKAGVGDCNASVFLVNRNRPGGGRSAQFLLTFNASQEPRPLGPL